MFHVLAEVVVGVGTVGVAGGLARESGSGTPQIGSRLIGEYAMMQSWFVGSIRLAAVTLAALGVFTHTHAQCVDWLPGQPASIGSGEFRAAALFDPDGPGAAAPLLVVGGDFSLPASGGSSIDDLASWDGVSWQRVFPLFAQGFVRALKVFDFDGAGPNPPRLVIGGQFSFLIGSNNVCVWNGQTLVPLAQGVSGIVNAIETHDPDGDGPLPEELFIAGQFSSSGSVPIQSRVAKWNGTAWEDSGTMSASTANALASVDLNGDAPGGRFLVAGGSLAPQGTPSNVAILNGTEWLPAGTGLNGEVRSLALADLDAEGPAPVRLLACGAFNNSGPVTNLRGQAYFDGTRWQPIAPLNQQGFASTGRAVGVFDPDGPGPLPAQVFLAGSIRLPGDQLPHALVRLEAGAWIPVVSQPFGGEVFAMTSLQLPGSQNPIMLTLGNLMRTTTPAVTLRIGVWDGQSIASFGRGLSANVNALLSASIDGQNRVIASGGFAGIPGANINGVAAFDGEGWTALGGSFVSAPYVLGSHDPDGTGPAEPYIVAGGTFTEVPGGAAAPYVARWNGTAWEAMGAGLPSFPRGFASFDPDADGPALPLLLATGGVVSGGPGTPNALYAWNGSDWSATAVFTSSNGPALVEDVTTFDPDGPGPLPRQVVVVGFFNRVNNVLVSNCAAFDGNIWRPMSTGFESNPLSVFTWDRFGDGREVVLATGISTTAGGVPVRGVAMWNGTSWAPLGNGFGVSQSGYQNYPSAFAVFDPDDDGPAPNLLHAIGGFSEADGLPAAGIARWNGQTWEALGAGLTPATGTAIAVLAATDERPARLCVGGRFVGAGGRASAYFAQFGAVACCPADFNADGYVNSNDLFEFLGAFFSSHADADVNADGFINTSDFFDVLAGVFVGC